MRALAVSIGVVVAGCAGTGPESESANLERPVLSVAAIAAEAKVVDIGELDKGLVCELRIPTGTHIASRHCYTRGQAAQRALSEEMALRDLEQLRSVQIYDDVAGQNARRRALAEASSAR